MTRIIRTRTCDLCSKFTCTGNTVQVGVSTSTSTYGKQIYKFIFTLKGSSPLRSRRVNACRKAAPGGRHLRAELRGRSRLLGHRRGARAQLPSSCTLKLTRSPTPIHRAPATHKSDARRHLHSPAMLIAQSTELLRHLRFMSD